MSQITEILKCHFCELTDNKVKHMIKGPEANICSNCVLLCCDIITEEDHENKELKANK
tara:strand:- start:1011 stop:1184 length:174 start_codon:yes stop_codon:yes gene_type:complete